MMLSPSAWLQPGAGGILSAPPEQSPYWWARILQWRAQTKSRLYVNVLTRVTAQQTGPARCRDTDEPPTLQPLHRKHSDSQQDTRRSHRSQPDSIQMWHRLKKRPSLQLRLSCGDIIQARRHQDQTPLQRQEVDRTGRHAFKSLTKIKAHRAVLKEKWGKKSPTDEEED